MLILTGIELYAIYLKEERLNHSSSMQHIIICTSRLNALRKLGTALLIGVIIW